MEWCWRHWRYCGGEPSTIFKHELIEGYTIVQLVQHLYCALYYIMQYTFSFSCSVHRQNAGTFFFSRKQSANQNPVAAFCVSWNVYHKERPLQVATLSYWLFLWQGNLISPPRFKLISVATSCLFTGSRRPWGSRCPTTLRRPRRTKPILWPPTGSKSPSATKLTQMSKADPYGGLKMNLKMSCRGSRPISQKIHFGSFWELQTGPHKNAKRVVVFSIW